MEPFVTLAAAAVPFDLANVDTDRIVPARFLRALRSEGYGKFLFHDLRVRPDGSEDPGFFLNQPQWRGAKILVAGENFGCGSSREAAVWALEGWGFRAWIAPSFGEIFEENSFKNGLLPVRLPAERVARLRDLLRQRPGAQLTIDLRAQTIALPDGSIERFELDPFRKECLLNGWDDIDLTLQQEAAIRAYEARQRTETPWLTQQRS